ncbi:hypothetical protein Tco_0213483 [Tanacetum coccineum]
MAISVISVSPDSSEDSIGTPARQVILFGTTIPDTTPVITPPTTQTDTTVIPIKTPIIAPTIPPSPDYTPASPDYSPTSDSESDPSEDPSSDHIPPLPAISPFLSSTDDTTDSDTPDTPPSPTHGIPFTEITSFTQRSPVIPRRRVMILAPGQPKGWWCGYDQVIIENGGGDKVVVGTEAISAMSALSRLLPYAAVSEELDAPRHHHILLVRNPPSSLSSSIFYHPLFQLDNLRDLLRLFL